MSSTQLYIMIHFNIKKKQTKKVILQRCPNWCKTIFPVLVKIDLYPELSVTLVPGDDHIVIFRIFIPQHLQVFFLLVFSLLLIDVFNQIESALSYNEIQWMKRDIKIKLCGIHTWKKTKTRIFWKVNQNLTLFPSWEEVILTR